MTISINESSVYFITFIQFYYYVFVPPLLESMRNHELWHRKMVHRLPVCQTCSTFKETQNKTLNRIEKMWIRDEAGYFFGPIFIHPEETEHEPTKMFYKKEVFLSNLEETCPMTCIIGNLLTLP